MDSLAISEAIRIDPLSSRILEEHGVPSSILAALDVSILPSSKTIEAENQNGKISIKIGASLIETVSESGEIAHSIAHYLQDQIVKNNWSLFVIDSKHVEATDEHLNAIVGSLADQQVLDEVIPRYALGFYVPSFATRYASYRLAQVKRKLQPLSFSEEEKQILNMLRKVAVKTKQKVYLVGGCIRDKLLGIPNTDLDFMVVTDDLDGFVQLVATENNLREPVKLERSQAYTMRIGSFDIDIIDARKVYVPLKQQVQSLEEEDDWTVSLDDIFRRDLTINAISYDLLENRIEDPTNRGFKDLQDGIVSTIIDPYVKYRINAFDMLRALRFAAVYDFSLGKDMLAAMKTNAHRLVPRDLGGDISNRRILRELRKAAINKETWLRMKKLLAETNLITQLQENVEKVEVQRTSSSEGKGQ